jgi:hypothetical protein
MVSLHNNLHPALVGNESTLAKTTTSTSTTSTSDSFTAQLATEIEGYLAKSGNGSHFEIDVQNGSVTVKNLDTATPAPAGPSGTGKSLDTESAALAGPPIASKNSTAAAPAPAAAGPLVTGISLMDAKPRSPSEIAAMSTQAALSTVAPTLDKSNMTPDDSYWAEQPVAVQALRDMPESDRQLAATDLAKKGYTIDVPIMVWGWDPLTTMVERQNYGYTWTPSALQAPVQLPPGLSFPGLPSYDAANAPAGSIKVTTDFAAGTNMQNVFIDPASILASLATSAANAITPAAGLQVPISS